MDALTASKRVLPGITVGSETAQFAFGGPYPR